VEKETQASGAFPILADVASVKWLSFARDEFELPAEFAFNPHISVFSQLHQIYGIQPAAQCSWARQAQAQFREAPCIHTVFEVSDCQRVWCVVSKFFSLSVEVVGQSHHVLETEHAFFIVIVITPVNIKPHIAYLLCLFMDSSVTYIYIVRGRKTQKPRQLVPSTLLVLT